jgi:DNA ligase (NAD+)
MQRMKELIELLNKASTAYYQKNSPIMSDYKYDALYDELIQLEKQTNTVLSNSPSINIGSQSAPELLKIKHSHKLLSLNKTKDISDLYDFLGNNKALLSFKLDGLTVVLNYKNGILKSAATRGDGEIGEDITHNIDLFNNIPIRIKIESELIIRGECVISLSEFDRINSYDNRKYKSIPTEPFKNPRNLCSGIIRRIKKSNLKIKKKKHKKFKKKLIKRFKGRLKSFNKFKLRRIIIKFSRLSLRLKLVNTHRFYSHTFKAKSQKFNGFKEYKKFTGFKIYKKFNRLKLHGFKLKIKKPDRVYNIQTSRLRTIKRLKATDNINTNDVKIEFFAFSYVTDIMHELKSQGLSWLANLGFEHVYYNKVTKDNLEKVIADLKAKAKIFGYASDGLVLTYNDTKLSHSLGATAKFPKDSIAFKWMDEIKNTILRKVEWNTSRIGSITPVAVFDEVYLEGTNVSRASLHNLSIIEQLELGIKDTITVYKANMIIPQIAENLTKSNNLKIPSTCPSCSGATEIMYLNDSKTLICTNPDCSAKFIKKLTHFVSRQGMNIIGLSENTLKKLIYNGFINNICDIFHLCEHEDKILTLPGFKDQSFKKLINSINNSRTTTVENFINALGIQNIGIETAKSLARFYKYDIKKIRTATIEELQTIEGFGSIMAKSTYEYFNNDINNELIDKLISLLNFNIPDSQISSNNILTGLTFVITGKLYTFENRGKLKDYIESLGGNCSSSISTHTDFLINNDITSNSSKNKKAKELGIDIITEQYFLNTYG